MFLIPRAKTSRFELRCKHGLPCGFFVEPDRCVHFGDVCAVTVLTFCGWGYQLCQSGNAPTRTRLEEHRPAQVYGTGLSLLRPRART